MRTIKAGQVWASKHNGGLLLVRVVNANGVTYLRQFDALVAPISMRLFKERSFRRIYFYVGEL